MAWIVLLFCWLVMGAAASTIAGGKGRNGDVWFLIGFLAGPLGLLAAMLLPMKDDD